MRFKDSEGSATAFSIAISFFLLLAWVVMLSFGAVAIAQSRATSSADLIALSGCELAHDLASQNNSHLVTCTDDGVTISVETRTRINLPLRVTALFAHARAQAVHDL